MVGDFTFHRPPMAHQLEAFERFKDSPFFALFIEQRGGKTSIALNVFRYRYEKGDVDALVVIAYPNGVHRVVIDELPKDFPPSLMARTRAVAWASGKMTRGARREEVLALRDHRIGPVVITMNCEALLTDAGWKYLQWFLARRRVMLVADESSWAKSWSARTRRLLSLGKHRNVIVKTIMDGTPCEEGAGELYFPTTFLSPGLLGYSTAEAFRERYFEYEEEEIRETRTEMVPCRQCSGDDARCVICCGVGTVATEVPTGNVFLQRIRKKRYGPGRRVVGEYEVFKGYRNIDELERKLKTFGVRVRRADISDAPPKVYQSRWFDLTEKQRRVYNDLREKYVAEVEGGRITAANVLLRMTRLSMVARNYYPPEKFGEACDHCGGEGFATDGTECDACGGIGIVVRTSELRRIDPDRNPAIDALSDELRASNGVPAVVWCRFRQDVLDVLRATIDLKLDFFRYDGGLDEATRESNYQRFRSGVGDGIVATIGSGLQRGKDLSRAGLLIYYSNDFSLRARRQSEDRAESLTRRFSTDVVDLVATDTRDGAVIAALREKRSIASAIMGDPVTAWL